MGPALGQIEVCGQVGGGEMFCFVFVIYLLIDKFGGEMGPRLGHSQVGTGPEEAAHNQHQWGRTQRGRPQPAPVGMGPKEATPK